MNRFIIILTLLALANVAGAQIIEQVEPQLEVLTPAQPKNLSKQERKALERREKELKDSLAYEKAGRALAKGYFVILADRLLLGSQVYVAAQINSNSNFVLVQGEKGIVQLAFNNGRMGANGLGGMTLEGTVGNVKFDMDKKENLTYNYSLVGRDVNAHVSITVYAGTGRAMAIVTPTFGRDQITIYGKLVPYVRPRD